LLERLQTKELSKENQKARIACLARIMYNFFTAATKSSGVRCAPTAFRDPQTGALARGATHSGRRFRRFVTRTYE